MYFPKRQTIKPLSSYCFAVLVSLVFSPVAILVWFHCFTSQKLCHVWNLMLYGASFFFPPLCRFDRVQLSLFPQSHPRSVWSWHRATRRQLVQQQPDGPEVRHAERKCCLKGQVRFFGLPGERGEIIREHTDPTSDVALLCERNCMWISERRWTELRVMKMDSIWSACCIVQTYICPVLQVTYAKKNKQKNSGSCAEMSKTSVSYVYLIGQFNSVNFAT